MKREAVVEPLPAIRLRPMVDQDVPSVRAIEALSFRQPWPDGAYVSELRSDTARLFTATACPVGIYPETAPGALPDAALQGPDPGQSEVVVGYVGMWVMADEMHITTIAVRPHWRRRGTATLLLLRALDEGRAQGAQRATLEVRRSNKGARRLYEALGFVVWGVRPRYYVDNDEDAVILWINDLWAPETWVRARRERKRALQSCQLMP